MMSERGPIFASLALSLALNSALFLNPESPFSAQQRWKRPEALSLIDAHRKARKIELEFVEASPQKPLRKPEKTRKISAVDSLAQDQSKLKTQAMTAPSIRPGVADQLNQRRMEDMLVPPLNPRAEIKPQPTVPKEPAAEESKPAAPQTPGDPQSWHPIQAKDAPAPKKEPSLEEKAQEKALEQAAQRMSARDKITTMEMAVKRSSGAPFQGPTSFEATGSGMGAYMKGLKDKIWLEWFPYIAFRYPSDFQSADAVIRFTIGRRGEVRAAEVIDYRGSPLFATFCLQVVRRAKYFGPLPDDLLAMMGKDELEIKFAFHYR